jgi:hypothetical protein
MVEELEFNDKYKIVRFYIEHLPFEILTEKENDTLIVSEWRKLELKKDFEKYGDYLHSDLYVERIKPEITEE